MTSRTLTRLFSKTLSLLTIFSLLLNTYLPFVPFIVKEVMATEPLAQSLSYNSLTKNFNFSVNTGDTVNYILDYTHSSIIEDVRGSGSDSSGNFSRTIFAGTCSDGTCPSHFTSSGTYYGLLKTRVDC